jgi:hypothetical protein
MPNVCVCGNVKIFLSRREMAAMRSKTTYCLSMARRPFVEPWPLFRFLDLFYTAGRAPRTGDQPIARPLLYTEQHKQNKRTQTSMPRVGLKPTTPAFEQAKTLRALNRAATEIDRPTYCSHINCNFDNHIFISTVSIGARGSVVG